jgi:hypothetical protein
MAHRTCSRLSVTVWPRHRLLLINHAAIAHACAAASALLASTAFLPVSHVLLAFLASSSPVLDMGWRNLCDL